jgi:hypothetical protein
MGSPTRQPRATGSSWRMVLYSYPLYLEVVATPTRSLTRQSRATVILEVTSTPYLEVVATPILSPTRQPRATGSSLRLELYSYPPIPGSCSHAQAITHSGTGISKSFFHSVYLEVVATPTRSPTRQPRATGSSLRCSSVEPAG